MDFKEKVFLVGDAAGLADAVTGEGIYFALKSGSIVAGAILADMKMLSVDRYVAEMDMLRRYVQQATKVRDRFYAHRSLVTKLACKHQSFVKFVCDKQVHKNEFDWHIIKMIFEHKKVKRKK